MSLEKLQMCNRRWIIACVNLLICENWFVFMAITVPITGIKLHMRFHTEVALQAEGFSRLTQSLGIIIKNI